MTTKSVLVLILSYNGKSLLEDSVSSYLACDYPNFKVAVIDNGSSDGTLRYLTDHFPEVITIRTNVNLGYSGGMNLGLSYAFDQHDYDYVLISNNDVKADSAIISSLVATAGAGSKVAFVTGKVYYYDAPDTFQTVGKKHHPTYVNGGHIGRGEKDCGQYDQDCEIAFCDDIYWLVSKEVYLTTGGYDPEFFLQAEDFDWQLRAKKAGYKIYYAFKAKLWHKESQTIGKVSAKKAYYDARNPTIAILKNCESKVAVAYIRQRVFRDLLFQALKQLIRMRLGISLAILGGLCSTFYWWVKEKVTIFWHNAFYKASI